MRSHLYILDHHTPVPVEDTVQWAIKFEQQRISGEFIVKQEFVTDNVYVSTIFLGLDHGLFLSEAYKPMLFETIIWGGRFISGKKDIVLGKRRFRGMKRQLQKPKIA